MSTRTYATTTIELTPTRGTVVVLDEHGIEVLAEAEHPSPDDAVELLGAYLDSIRPSALTEDQESYLAEAAALADWAATALDVPELADMLDEVLSSEAAQTIASTLPVFRTPSGRIIDGNWR